MPKHRFSLHQVVSDAVKQHVRKAIAGIPTQRYRQEAAYTAQLWDALDGTAYEGEHGVVTFNPMVFGERSHRLAVSLYGADFAITATISDGRFTVHKVILIQAADGRISDLDPLQQADLREQIETMWELVNAPKLMELPEADGFRRPAVISANRFFANQPYTPVALPEYFSARVLTTLDGCSDLTILHRVQNTAIHRLSISARIVSAE